MRRHRLATSLVALSTCLLAVAGFASPFIWPPGGWGFAPTAAVATA
jgi:hypothetical protein